MPVDVSSVLTAGLRTEFADAYDLAIKAASPNLQYVMRLGIPSDKLIETYGGFESAPIIERWARGEQIPEGDFNSFSWTVRNYDWGIRIPWHKDDRQDDQLQKLYDRARGAGASYAKLPERLFFQVLTSATDNKLLPAIPTAPDGQALFATTKDGSNARFGISSGNLLSGSGVDTVAHVHTDYYAAYEQFCGMLDTQDEPLWPPETIDQGLMIIHSSADEEIFARAFGQVIVQGSSAGISNVLLDRKVPFTRWSTARLSTGDWFVALMGCQDHQKAVFEQVRQPLEFAESTRANSDEARLSGIESVQWDSRGGVGVAVPYSIIKINN